MTEREIATKILQAMDLREKSYKCKYDCRTNDLVGWYEKTIQECFNLVFNNSALGKLYALTTVSCWNETEKWCNDVLKCEALKY
mgnify:FL=1|jgi:hypothetical protein